MIDTEKITLSEEWSASTTVTWESKTATWESKTATRESKTAWVNENAVHIAVTRESKTAWESESENANEDVNYRSHDRCRESSRRHRCRTKKANAAD